MTELEQDPLIARLRRSDPASPVISLPNREALRRHRSRRSATRAKRLVVGAAAVAGAVTLAVSLGPSSGPTADDVLARAAAATAPPEGKIVEMRVRVDAGGTGWDSKLRSIKPWSLWEERTSWVRFSSDGKVLAARTLMTDGSPGENGRSQAGVDEVYELVDGKHVSKRFDPAKEDVYTDHSQPIPGLTFKAHRLFEAAQAGDARVRVDGEETVDGRRAYRLVVSAWDEPKLPPNVRERRELLIDRETYQPIVERVTSRGTTSGGTTIGVPDGKPFDDKLTERVVSYRELPDTPENRRLLELHGGEAQK